MKGDRGADTPSREGRLGAAVTAYALIVNPVAGKGRALLRARALAGALQDSADVRVLETGGRGDAVELAREAASAGDRVVAVGGDGTLNEVANGVLSASIPGAGAPLLGYFPAGTANAATRAFRVAREPHGFASALLRDETMELDVGIVRHAAGVRAFLLWLGAGWDAVVIRALNEARSGRMGVGGLMRGLPRVLNALGRYEEVVIEASVDGASFGPYTSVVVANVGGVAFGGSVAERADPCDGHLDVIGVPALSPFRTADLMRRLMLSSLTTSSAVGHAACARIELSADGPVPLQIDGEPIGQLPATVEVRPKAIRFLKTQAPSGSFSRRPARSRSPA